MSDRVDWHFRQKVTEAELDSAFTYLEQADWDQNVDLGLTGIAYGLAVTQAGSPNLTVQVATGAAYDKLGRRTFVPSGQSADVSQDFNNVTTSVTSPGNNKWISLFAVFDRDLSDPRVDGNSLTVYFEVAESFSFKVVQSVEAPVPTRPSLDGTNILLCDIARAFGQTTIVNANIDTTRRELTFNSGGSPRSIAKGKVSEAIADLLGYYNNHVGGSADRHAATAVDYAGGTTWQDGTTNPATTVELQLDKVITDLRGTSAGNSGAHKIGADAQTVGTFSLSAGTLRSQLTSLLTSLNTLDTTFVKLAGTQTITGAKTFTETVVANKTGNGNAIFDSGTHTVNSGEYKLVWVFGRSSGSKWRFYLAGSGRLVLTINAAWSSGTTWTKDSSGGVAGIISFSGIDFSIDRYVAAGSSFDTATDRVGQFKVEIGEGLTSAPKDVILRDEGYLEAPGEITSWWAWQGFVNGTSDDYGVALQYPKKFPANPSSVTFSAVSSSNMNGSYPQLGSAEEEGARIIARAAAAPGHMQVSARVTIS